jgi:hypothetical protein
MAKKFSLVLGVVLLVVGLWGLFSGGHAHNLLIFGINMAHNWVHILSGAVGLIAALAGERYAKFYCLAFSGVYGIVTLGGLFRVTALVQFLNLNMADNILHLVITVGCFWFGMKSKPA